MFVPTQLAHRPSKSTGAAGVRMCVLGGGGDDGHVSVVRVAVRRGSRVAGPTMDEHVLLGADLCIPIKNITSYLPTKNAMELFYSMKSRLYSQIDTSQSIIQH